jgi:nucleotide-binding universal stress UspA family protein
MLEIKNILVPVDFSEVAPFVVEWAKNFARKLGAKIKLIYVLEDFSTYEGIYSNIQTFAEMENILMDAAQSSMEEFLKKYFSDFPEVESIIVKGDIVEKIIEVGEEVKADLIIMGTHGRKGLDKILFGSVAEGVVKNSPIPVVTINPYRMKKEK